jgi:hypothetical protein
MPIGYFAEFLLSPPITRNEVEVESDSVAGPMLRLLRLFE